MAASGTLDNMNKWELKFILIIDWQFRDILIVL